MIRFFAKKISPNEWRKNLQKEGLQDSEDFLLGNFQSYLTFQKWNEWLDSSPNDLSSNDSRRNIWKEDYFRIFLFRRSSIIFDLAGKKRMIRFFIKKSSTNESRNNLQKESLHDSEDFSLVNFQSYLACQKCNEWLDSSSKNLRPMILEEISEKKFFLE